MRNLLYVLIVLFSSASYFFALQNIFRGRYRPNVFSRAVWALLGINSFAGILLSDSSSASIALTAVMMIGSLAVFVTSLKTGRRSFGWLEKVCLALLLVSAVVWVAFDEPLVNVGISLFAHFLGALPTYRHVFQNPRSESRKFWGFFLLASILSVLASSGTSLPQQMVPIYYTIFDGSVFALSLRPIKRSYRSSRSASEQGHQPQ